MDKSERKFSTVGVIISAVNMSVALIVVFRSLKNNDINRDGFDTYLNMASPIPILLPAVVLIIRSFRLPMGFWKGLLSWFGGLFIGICFTFTILFIGPFGGRAILQISNIMVILVFLIPGIVLLRYGFRMHSKNRIPRS